MNHVEVVTSYRSITDLTEHTPTMSLVPLSKWSCSSAMSPLQFTGAIRTLNWNELEMTELQRKFPDKS